MAGKPVLNFLGKITLATIKEQGGDKWVKAVTAATVRAKNEDPSVGAIKFNGARPHKSHTDKTETRDVISMQLYDKDGKKRIRSGHITDDGAIKYSKGKQSEDADKSKDPKKGGSSAGGKGGSTAAGKK